MRLARKTIFILLAALALVNESFAALSPAEQRALTQAEQAFQLGLWERAEKNFADFAARFPKSDDRATAILRQAQARLKQNKFSGAIELLTKPRDAGRLADEFLFWLAEANFQATNYSVAADAYTKLATVFTNSPHVLEASYSAALARSKLGDWPRVDDLLLQSDGAFQLTVLREPTNEFVVRGTLLLGEAQLALNNFAGVEETLRPLATQKLIPELDWRRQFLLCRAQLAADHADAALATAANLAALATAAGKRDLQAETAALRGSILERLKRFDDAVTAYEANLADDLPVERRRQAVLKIVELLLARNKVAAAAQRLETFLGEHLKDTAADAALLAVGELHLKEFLASADTNRVSFTATDGAKNFPSASNHLAQAFAQFDLVVKNFPRSPVAGRALADRAWCWWLNGQMTEARGGFQQAVEKLPATMEQASARFKLADCQMALGDFAGALTNYSAVLNGYPGIAAVKNELAEPALYQTVRACLARDDFNGATNALGKILAAYPDGFLTERGLLLAGEKLNRAGNPKQARELFNASLQKFPKSQLAPEAQLAAARTFEQEQSWAAAIAAYDTWLANFAGHDAQPRAEFARANCLAQSGQGTNALAAFTRIVAQFPANDLAPLAQNWIADFYLQQGDFAGAEKNYQLVYQNTNWPPSVLTYSARLMAGRAAAARLGFGEAAGYFTKLINDEINDKSCPPEIVAQAFFDLGDSTARMETTETNKPLANLEEAIRSFNKIPQLYPNSELAPLALGRAGNCYFQLAARDPKFYDSAIQTYKQVLDAPRANAAARSDAEVGIGLALEKQSELKGDDTALLKLAQERYLNVALATNLREQEQPDAFWVKKASLEAARVAESLGDWPQAVNLYSNLSRLLPPL
jgi:TolA-binding protein